MSPVERYLEGLAKRDEVIASRADKHARMIASAVAEEMNAEAYFMKPQRISLSRLTKALIARKLRSARNTPLTPTAVDRACARAGFDWRHQRMFLIDNRRQIAQAHKLWVSVNPNMTEQFKATKIRRANEYKNDLLDIWNKHNDPADRTPVEWQFLPPDKADEPEN